MERLSHPDEDRFLVIDDTDEDISQILTVICEGRPRAALFCSAHERPLAMTGAQRLLPMVFSWRTA